MKKKKYSINGDRGVAWSRYLDRPMVRLDAHLGCTPSLPCDGPILILLGQLQQLIWSCLHPSDTLFSKFRYPGLFVRHLVSRCGNVLVLLSSLMSSLSLISSLSSLSSHYGLCRPPTTETYPETSPCSTIWSHVVVNCLLPASKVSCSEMHPSFTEASSPFRPEQLVWQ